MPVNVLRPEVPSWERPAEPPDRAPWWREEEDPEQLAREAIAELQGALEDLSGILDLLGASSVCWYDEP